MIRTTMEAARGSFSSGIPRNTSDMPYDVRGNEVPRGGSGGSWDSSPIPGGLMQGSEGDIGQFLKPGRLPHKHNFNIGRNSGRTKNEQPEEENGPGTNT